MNEDMAMAQMVLLDRELVAAVLTPSKADVRQYLTIVFSDLCASTRIAAAMEPESYAELLGHLRDLFHMVVPRHGGDIIRMDGDGMLCIFGHPAQFEDVGRRAVEAACDLHGAASALEQAFAPPGMRIRLHTGIHSGIVLLREGDLVRGRFEVLGDATNVAAKLCDLAGADAILVSEETLGADCNFFRTGARRLIDVGGRSGRLPVLDVHGRDDTETRFAARVRRGVAPFSGRTAETAQLEACLAECTSGPRIAAIIGQAGIGKTRLASEFLAIAQARGIPVARGYCESYLGAHPLQPFVHIVRAILAPQTRAAGDAIPLAAGLQTLSPEHAAALARLLTPDALEPLRLDDAIPAVEALLEQATTTTPAILFIDDWQWADDASRKMLYALAESISAPLLFLLASRQFDAELASPNLAAIVDVPLLATSEAASAIEGLLNTAEPFIVEQICDYAGGSPLFIEELCHAWLVDEQAIIQPDRSNWLDMLVKARFERLPREQADHVKAAAVIGHIFPGWLFETLTGLATGHPMLRDLGAADFIYAGDVSDTLRFKHGITRDAVYRTIPLAERRALHRRVVDALHAHALDNGTEEQAEALAHHYAASGNAERALHYGLLAGGKALAASALDRAQALYRAAFDVLVALESSPERTRQTNELIQKYGLSCVFDPSPEQLPALHRLAALATSGDNTQGLALAEFWLGVICYGLGRAHHSIAHLEKALSLAKDVGNPRLYNQMKANLGQSHLAAAHCTTAARLLDEVIVAMDTPDNAGRFSGLPYAQCCRAFLLADQGHFASAAAYYARVDALLSGTEPPMFGSYITQAAVVSIWQGDYPAAIRHAERGIALAARARSRYFAVMSRALRAYARWCLAPDDSAAVDDLVQSSQWFLSGASQQRCSLLFGWLAEMMVARGEPERARFYAAKAFRRAHDGDRLGEATAARAMARLSAQGHGQRTASHYLALAHRSATGRESPREAALTHLCAAELADAAGRHEQAAAAREAAQHCERMLQAGLR